MAGSNAIEVTAVADTEITGRVALLNAARWVDYPLADDAVERLGAALPLPLPAPRGLTP